MDLSDKFDEYFKDTGIQKMWMANKLGLSRTIFYGMANGRIKVSKRFWSEIIRLTNGKISIEDLLQDEFKDYPEILALLKAKRIIK